MDVCYSDKQEMKRIKRMAVSRSSTVGAFMLISSILSFVFAWMFNTVVFAPAEANIKEISAFLSDITGFSRMECSVIVKEILYSGILEELFTMLSMLVTVFVPAYIAGKIWGKSVSDCFVTGGKLVKGFLFVYAFSQLAMLCTTSIADGIWTFIFPTGAGDMLQPQGVFSENAFVVLISFVCSCIMVPVIEEYAFRGVMYKILRDAGISFAVVASALCFGLMHNSVTQCMYAFTFGLVSAMLVELTGNIKTSVIFHVFNNTVSFLTAFIPSHFGEEAKTVFEFAHIVFVLSFSFYGMYLFFSKDGILSEFRTKTDEQSQHHAKLSYLFTLPFVMYIVLFAARSVLGVM